MNPARNHPDLHAKHGMAQVDFEMRYKTQAIADLEDVVHQSQKEASARGLDALLAAADAQGEGEEAWVMKDAEAKGLLRECLKRVLLLEEVARKRDKEREALEMEVCVCVCGGCGGGGGGGCVSVCVCMHVHRYILVCISVCIHPRMYRHTPNRNTHAGGGAGRGGGVAGEGVGAHALGGTARCC